MRIKEIKCKKVLNPCKIEGFDYNFNPYVGCSHGCVYCYAKGYSVYPGDGVVGYYEGMADRIVEEI